MGAGQDYEGVGIPLFSRDGSKIAFVATQHDKQDLLVLDVDKGVLTKVPYLDKIPLRTVTIRSWSPDGKQFAVMTQRPKEKESIAVLDVDTGNVRFLGEGVFPTWSPTGEWIAYYDERAGAKCLVVHPDGTGTKIVKKLRQSWYSNRGFAWGGPVWSPDGKQLLVNEMKGDYITEGLDVVLLDLESGRNVTKLRNGLPVFGWASRK